MDSKLIEAHLPCPNCSSSDAYSTYDDGHGYCFSCKTYVPPEEKDHELESKYTYEYLSWRGVSAETYRTFGCRTKINSEGRPIAIGYAYPGGGVKIRNLDEKSFYTKGELKGLFGSNVFSPGSHKYVTITEGEQDALSFYEVLRSPVLSVKSSSTARGDVVGSLPSLSSYERIYLAFDNDDAGRRAMLEVARLFDYDRVYIVSFGNEKDASDLLQAGRGEELRNCWLSAKRYLPEKITSSLAEFKEILSEPPKWGIPYPWPTLTEMTYGIRRGETTLITAQEGVGKTEICHAIEYTILRGTNDNVGAIFLEELPRRHLQALAGIHLNSPVHLPDTSFSTSQVFSAAAEVIQKDERLYLLNHFGSLDPEVLLDDIRFLVSARSCRYVLLDHISMVVAGSEGQDERRELDRISTKLESMVKELDFALIIVSHVNDWGQTRGSRMMGKICDTRIDLIRDLTNSNSEIRNTTYLNISKNRFGMKTGPAGAIKFDPLTYSFREVGYVPLRNTSEDKTKASGYQTTEGFGTNVPANDNQEKGEAA